MKPCTIVKNAPATRREAETIRRNGPHDSDATSARSGFGHPGRPATWRPSQRVACAGAVGVLDGAQR